jgi:hypothetical protein
MRGLWRAVVRRYRAYAAWFGGLPPEVQAEIIRNQKTLL